MNSISISYKGFAEEVLSSDDLLNLFDSLWGKMYRRFPRYPEVTGGISGFWRNADGHKYHVSNIDEILKPYKQKATYDIHINGKINNNPRCMLVYTPYKKEAAFQVTAPTAVIANQYIESVKKMFPNKEIPIVFVSYAAGEVALADFAKEIIEQWTKNRVEVFIAKRSIVPGSDPLKTMEAKMKSASICLPICSCKSKDSQWVWWESAAIWGASNKVYPLFTNISPESFGAPLNLFTQGANYFNKDEMIDTMKTICKDKRIEISRNDFTSKELAEYKKLERKYSHGGGRKIAVPVANKNIKTFEKLVETGSWQKELIDHTEVYVCDSDNTYQIEIGPAERKFTEKWTQVYPDKYGSGRHSVYLKIGGVKIKQLLFIHCDGGKIFVPIPDIERENGSRIFVWHKESLEYKVACIVGDFYIYKTLEGVAGMSKIKIK